MNSNIQPNTIATSDRVSPRYDLKPEEIGEIETELLFAANKLTTDGGIVATWISPWHNYSNLLRSYEAVNFPEVVELPEDIEDRSLFLALVDTRDGVERVVHSTTVSGILGRKAGDEIEDEEGVHITSGFIVIDDLVEMGNFTNEEFWDYYNERGIDLEHSMSVETNFRVGDRVESYSGLSTSDIAYLSLFRLLKRRANSLNTAVVFANINGKSIHSFERVGIVCEPLMGRSNLVTSESMQGLDFKPVAIPSNAKIFDQINLDVPEISFGVSL